MFANKLRITLADGDREHPVVKSWLDQFFMRNFTGPGGFDDTLVLADGELEAGHTVSRQEVEARLETWLRGRRCIPLTARVIER